MEDAEELKKLAINIIVPGFLDNRGALLRVHSLEYNQLSWGKDSHIRASAMVVNNAGQRGDDLLPDSNC